MKRFATMLLALVMCFSIAVPASAQSTAPSKKDSMPALESKNISGGDYTTWADTVKSYLYENGEGGLTRVECTGGQRITHYEYVNGELQSWVENVPITIVAEDYDSSYRCISSRTIPMELSIWGGFYAGKDYNFIIFGQSNQEEDDSKEVIRVVKYDKDWNRLGQASLKDANTTVPFDAGSLRCDEYNGYLYIRTSHEMYTTSDGYNHQSNMTLAVRESDMTITDSYYDIMNNAYGYVSHSFNQFIIVDEEGKAVCLDHGDASPRGMAFTKYYADAGTGKFTGNLYSQWCSYANLCAFADNSANYNITGASIGGLAESRDCYIFAYNYDGIGGGGERYPYFHYMDKATGKSWQVKINLPGCTTPMLAATGLDGGYMLWNAKSGSTVSDTLYYLHYGPDGAPEQYKTAKAPLSECQPIYHDGKVVWYVTDNGAPTFYTLDESGVEKKITSAKSAFTDMSDKAFYLDPVVWAVNAGVTNGTGDGSTFSPNKACTHGEILTFLWRAAGAPESSAQPPIAMEGGEFYYQAAKWAAEKGMIDSGFNPKANCTRAAAVKYIWQAFGQPAVSYDGRFTDISDGSPYAAAVAWALKAGVTTGATATTFNPDGICNRGQIVTFLFRAMQGQ